MAKGGEKARIRWGNTKYLLSSYLGWQFFEFIPPATEFQPPLRYILEDAEIGSTGVTSSTLTYKAPTSNLDFILNSSTVLPYKFSLLNTYNYRANLAFLEIKAVTNIPSYLDGIDVKSYSVVYDIAFENNYELRAVSVVGAVGKRIVIPDTCDGGTYLVPESNCDGGTYLIEGTCVCDGGTYLI
jgi:hypothetical protein